MEPNFNLSDEDMRLVNKIVERAIQLGKKHGGGQLDQISLGMDLVATHNHACRLRLADLLESDDFNFIHDIAGIVRHLDRQALTLKNCFLPRFASND